MNQKCTLSNPTSAVQVVDMTHAWNSVVKSFLFVSPCKSRNISFKNKSKYSIYSYLMQLASMVNNKTYTSYCKCSSTLLTCSVGISPSIIARYWYSSVKILKSILDGPPSRSVVKISQMIPIAALKFWNVMDEN